MCQVNMTRRLTIEPTKVEGTLPILASIKSLKIRDYLILVYLFR
jgi:hypothetical protein